MKFNLKYRISVLLGISMILQSCVRDGVIPCEPEPTYIYQVKIVDTSAEGGMPTRGDVNKADLYVFNEEGYFLERIEVAAEDITNGRIIPLGHTSQDGPLFVSTWGNLFENEDVPALTSDSEMDHAAITLRTTAEGYAVSPDDLFFGMKEILPVENNRVQEIYLSRKNARMHITVRGLSAKDDYFFLVEQNYNGYSFAGQPTQHPVLQKEDGEFALNGEFISHSSFNLIHAGKEDMDGQVVVRLMKKQGTELISIDKDYKGNPIIPKAGETTNVLINLSQTISDNLWVYVEVTPWNEIYQWSEWKL